MSDRRLLVTTTGEAFQPTCLHYSLLDGPRLEACFRKLKCMHIDKQRNRWVWEYDDEARSLKFDQSWDEVSKHNAVVLGSFYFRGTSEAELYMRSIERALMAVAFFKQYVPRTVALITAVDVANRLFSADERDLTPETLFAPAEASLRQQAVEREAQFADPQQLLADFHQQRSGGQEIPLPELERLLTNSYGNGIAWLHFALRLRQRLAMEHWNGNREMGLLEVIRQALTGQTAFGDHHGIERDTL